VQVTDLAEITEPAAVAVVLAAETDLGEQRLLRGERLVGGVRTDVLIVGERLAAAAFHRHDGAGEPLLRPCGSRLCLRRHPEGIQLRPFEPFDRGDDVGGDAHLDRADRIDGRRIAEQRPVVRVHRHMEDRFDAAGQQHASPIALDPRSSQVDRLDARCAEAIDRHSRDVVTPTAEQCRGLGDVGALLVVLRGAPDDDVVDGARIETRPGADLLVEAHQQLRRRVVEQPALRRCLTPRRADGVGDERFRHGDAAPTTKLTAVVAEPPTFNVAKRLAPSTW